MFGWEDISYRNGAIRKKGVENLGVLAKAVQSSLGMTSQPGVIFLSLGVSFVVAHLTGSPSFGHGAGELAEDTQSLWLWAFILAPHPHHCWALGPANLCSVPLLGWGWNFLMAGWS